MHELVAIHFAIGIHRHLATRIACKRVDVRATKTKTGDHGRLAVRCCLDKIGACPLQALLELGFACRGGHEYKFISTDTEQHFIVLHGLGERATDAQNIAVALGVAKLIVAVLKVIDVNIGTGKGSAFAPELIDMAVESTAVAKIGERIDIGATFEQLAFLLQDGERFLQLLADGAQLRGQCVNVELGG